MPILVLAIVAFVVVLVVSKRIRSVLFHVQVRQFLFIVGCVTILLIIAGAGYAAWKYWWPLYMEIPVVEWNDSTLEKDSNPVTPGAGGPKTPTVIQVR